MRRLYQKIYLTIIASLLLVVLVAGGVWRWGGGPAGPQVFEMAGELASMASAAGDRAARRAAARDRTACAALPHRSCAVRRRTACRSRRPAGRCRRRRRDGEGGWAHGPGGPAWSFRLPDDRWLVVRAPGAAPPSGHRLRDVPGRHRAGCRACGLSGGARPDAPAGASAGRRRDTLGAGNLSARVRGRRQGRGRAARRELQSRGGADRGIDGRAPHAARQCVARIAHAAVAHPPWHRSAPADPRSEISRRRWSATSPSST